MSTREQRTAGAGADLTIVVLVILLAWIGLALAGEQIGWASTYGHNKGPGDGARQKVACGGRLDVYDFTAAHRTLPCGTLVTITNLVNKKQVVVTINDRGPFVKGRIIDVSPPAAEVLGMGYGLAKVRLAW